MPKFKVDVKAFLSVTVEADDPQQARAAANLYAEFGPEFELGEDVKVLEDDGWNVDGWSEVERVCAGCDTFLDHGEGTDELCFDCARETADA